MAIIRASRNFEGGDLNQKASTYIKSGTRVVDFKNKENGVFLFLLGAYKQDNNGNGVWYKPLRIRDNFGMGLYKEKFAVQPNCPVEYFANKVQTFAADMAKSKKVQDDDGRDRWVYPVWGRNAYRVLYNAAILNDYAAGVQVLDLPMSGGGSVIDDYMKGKDENNESNPDLTDYENAIPVNIKLDLKAKGQPWKITINQGKKYTLPKELADTEYLYNLDDVVLYPDKDQLIEKLKSVVPTDIFNKGMDGYSSGDRVVVNVGAIPKKNTPVVIVPSTPLNTDNDVSPEVENPVNIPKSSSKAPTFNIPKANSVRNEEVPLFTPPSSPGTSAALKAAADFLNNGKK